MTGPLIDAINHATKIESDLTRRTGQPVFCRIHLRPEGLQIDFRRAVAHRHRIVTWAQIEATDGRCLIPAITQTARELIELKTVAN